MPGPTDRSRRSAAGASPQRNGRSTASQMTWVPGLDQRHDADLRERAAVPRPVVGRPKARSFSGVSATSSVVPSIAIKRSPPRKRPPSRAVAIGPATAWNSSRSSRAPARRRAWTIAAVLGSRHLEPRARSPPPRQPATTSASTCRIDSAAHSPIATTSVTTRWVGSRRRRRSRVPVASIAASTAASGIAAASASNSGRSPSPPARRRVP